MNAAATHHAVPTRTPGASPVAQHARTNPQHPPQEGVSTTHLKSSSGTGWGTARRLTDTELLGFERKGYIVLRGLLRPELLQALKKEAEAIVATKRLQALQQRVRVLCPPAVVARTPPPLTEAAAVQLLRSHGSDEVGFLQFFNSHVSNALFRQLVYSEALTGPATQLLGVKRLRLFQDCIFYKEPGYAETNWHSDLRMTPLDTNNFLTAWVPLRAIAGASPPGTSKSDPPRSKEGEQPSGSTKRTHRKVQDSGMQFAAGSHRDFALPFWHDMRELDLSTRGYDLQGTGSMEIGDVSFHHGWLLHSAGSQPKGTKPRYAVTASYFADGARLLRKKTGSVHKHMLSMTGNNEDQESYGGWLAGMKDGAVASCPSLPLVFPPHTHQGFEPSSACPPTQQEPL